MLHWCGGSICLYIFTGGGGVNEGLLSRYCLPLAARRCYLALVFFGVGLRVIGGCVWWGCVLGVLFTSSGGIGRRSPWRGKRIIES